MGNFLGKYALTVIVCLIILGLAILARAPHEALVAVPKPVSHPFQPNIRVSIDPETYYQPRSGEVRITVENVDPADNTAVTDIPIAVQFRWKTKHQTAGWVEATALRTLDIPNPKKIVIGATVPELDEAPSVALAGVVSDQEGVRSFLTLIPDLEVWVTGEKPNKPGFEIDEVDVIGVTTFWFGASAAVGTVALLLLFLRLHRPAGLRGDDMFLQIIETESHRASLSQFQIVLWTLVIGGSTAYVMAMSGNLIPLTSGTLALLGISSVATLGSALAAGPAPATKPVIDGKIKPAWADLIADDGQIDVTRTQMLFFTVLMAIYVVAHVIDTYQIPPIPDSFLTLMGISNGVYLVNKFLPSGGLSKDQAQQKLTEAGYTGIAGLTQASDGGWTATATRDGAVGPVKLAKDGTVAVG